MGASLPPFAVYTGGTINGVIQNVAGIVSIPPGVVTPIMYSGTAGTVTMIANVPTGALDVVVTPSVPGTRWYATVRLNNVSFTV
jgi:hypothetical protein